MSAKTKIDDVMRGMWIAVEHLVVSRDEPVVAKEICIAGGITPYCALKLIKENSFQTVIMRRFVREELLGWPKGGAA